MDELKSKIIQAINKAVGRDATALLEFGSVPEGRSGDISVKAFRLMKELGGLPPEIAVEVKALDEVKDVVIEGGYINLFLDDDFLVRQAKISSISDASCNKKVMIEYLSPNTNKPLHLGHLRNGCLGSSMANIFKFIGCDVVRANLVNDRGIHICKSMIAWQRFGQGQTPQSTGIKGDHFVGKWYVEFAKKSESDPSLEEGARQLLLKWENNDPEVLEIWKKMNGWVYEGFEETYRKVGFEFDVFYYESQIYKAGKDLVMRGLEEGVFQKNEDGSIFAELPSEFGQDENGNNRRIVVLRSDGTSLYVTQDLYLAVAKASDFNLDRSINVVGSEQDFHFKCLFYILSLFKSIKVAENHHLSYGMVYLPDGKMKSREGNVVDIDMFVEDVNKSVLDEMNKKEKTDRQVSPEVISHKIALAAIKFYLLRVGAKQDIYYDKNEAVSMDGFTGPYCQYSYVRAINILKKSGSAGDVNSRLFGNLPQDRALLVDLLSFRDSIKRAANDCNPAMVANYVFSLAKRFNQFYHGCNIMNESDEQLKNARLFLVASTAEVIKKGLELLGIETVEEM
jgi:arginyl-tRNA synthetase